MIVYVIADGGDQLVLTINAEVAAEALTKVKDAAIQTWDTDEKPNCTITLSFDYDD